ncbi:MAG TPA: hypothetical protein VKU19_16030 [Bryobacteraceae bacterium]|nr:hypothetical protein [Bryobacteraceae bacterium]
MALRKRHWGVTSVCALGILCGWVVRDLSAKTRHDLADFDAHEVARLETEAWRSYYAHEKLHLLTQMVTLLRTQYHMPFWRAWVAAYHAAHAAIVFQPGHNRAEYERALPDLIRLYSLVRRGSETDFPVDHVAKLELEWWIIHRERAAHQPGDLERALADEQAEIFQQPLTCFVDHAKARAEAMIVRDSRAESGLVTDADWRAIASLLDQAWVSLRVAVTPSQ